MSTSIYLFPDFDRRGQSGTHDTLNGRIIMVSNGAPIALTINVGRINGVRVSTLGFQRKFRIMLICDTSLCEENSQRFSAQIGIQNAKLDCVPPTRTRRILIQSCQSHKQLSQGKSETMLKGILSRISQFFLRAVCRSSRRGSSDFSKMEKCF